MSQCAICSPVWRCLSHIRSLGARPIGRDSTIFHLFMKQDSFTYDYNLALIDICNNKIDCRKNDIGNKLTTQFSVFLKKSRFIFFIQCERKPNMKKQNVKTDHRSHFLVVIETIYEQLVHTLIGSPYCSPLIRFAWRIFVTR